MTDFFWLLVAQVVTLGSIISLETVLRIRRFREISREKEDQSRYLEHLATLADLLEARLAAESRDSSGAEIGRLIGVIDQLERLNKRLMNDLADRGDPRFNLESPPEIWRAGVSNYVPASNSDEEVDVHEYPEVPDFLESIAIQGYQVDAPLPSDGSLEPESGAPSEELGPHEYVVWFGTDRQPNLRGDEIVGFLDQREDQQRLHVGSCRVSIPKTHHFGEVKSAWWSRWARGDFRSDALSLTDTRVSIDHSAFSQGLRAMMEDLGPLDRSVVIYVHGFNCTFEQSAIRSAQIGFDLKVGGAMAFFSWPSRGMGSVAGYLADEATIEASEKRFGEFVTLIAQTSAVDEVHIIAHSMGNRLLARAAQAVADSGVRLGQIILAAPDIDVDVFRRLSLAYSHLAGGATMYVCAKDKALGVSAFLHGSPRVGFAPPITVVPGIETIDVGDLDLGILGHGYFAGAHAVLYDMRAVLFSQEKADRRQRLRKVVLGDSAHWAFLH